MKGFWYVETTAEIEASDTWKALWLRHDLFVSKRVCSLVSNPRNVARFDILELLQKVRQDIVQQRFSLFMRYSCQTVLVLQ